MLRPSLRHAVLAVTVLSLSLSATARAQSPTRERHTQSFGLLGGASVDALQSSGAATYDQRVGWAIGAWYNLPLGFGLSFEPQLQYGSFNSRVTAGTGSTRARPFLDNASVGFIIAPLVMKVHVGRVAAVTLGAQLDYPLSVADSPNYWTTDSLSSVAFSGTAGVELFPHGRVVVYSRYVRGLSNLNATSSAATTGIRAQSLQAGIKVRLSGRRQPADQDGDGLRGKADKCPTVAGVAKELGCPAPDTDGDGVLDADDACPKEAGLAANRGCAPPPPPVVLDRDADGVVDASDRCPTTAGSPALGGCPDSDNDGFEDALDKCPKAAGTAAAPRGCPRLTGFMPSDVTFEGATARLTASGRAELDKVTAYLTMYPNVTAELVGHLDNLGSVDSGLGLSLRRAEASRDFIVIQGIALERLSVRSEGGRRPTTSNRTAEGRMLNRRIEVILR